MSTYSRSFWPFWNATISTSRPHSKDKAATHKSDHGIGVETFEDEIDVGNRQIGFGDLKGSLECPFGFADP